MKLKATDQIHISAVQADTLRPGQEFEVADDVGESLLKTHAGSVQAVSGGRKRDTEKAEEAPANKAERAPLNKATLGAATTKKRWR